MDRCEAYQRLISIFNNEISPPSNIARLLSFDYNDEEMEMLIEVIEKEMSVRPNRTHEIIVYMLKNDIIFEYFNRIYGWLFEMYERGEDSFIVNETVCELIVANDFRLNKQMKEFMPNLLRKYKLDILRSVIIRMNNVYAPLGDKINRVVDLYSEMFTLPLDDMFKDNNIFYEDIFYGWFLDQRDMIHVMRNNSIIPRDSYVRVILSKLEGFASDADHETIIEDVLFRFITTQLKDASENIPSLSFIELMDTIDKTWEALEIYNRIALAYYMYSTYDNTLALNLLINNEVRVAYTLIYLYFVHVSPDREEYAKFDMNSDGRVKNTYDYDTSKPNAMDILDRLCG